MIKDQVSQRFLCMPRPRRLALRQRTVLGHPRERVDLRTSRSEPDRPEPDRPEPDRPEPDRPEPDRPEPDRPEPDRPEPDRPEPYRLEPDDQYRTDRNQTDRNRTDRTRPTSAEQWLPIKDQGSWTLFWHEWAS